MRKMINKLLNIALFGIVLFALDQVPERLGRMTRTTQNLVEQVGYSGVLAGIPLDVPGSDEF